MIKQGTLLIVDDNRNILKTLRLLTGDIFRNVIMISNPNNIPSRLREDHPDVVLLDMNFGRGINNGNEGLFWLKEIKKARPFTRVVLFTAYADIDLAVTGLKEGATDFIVKPFDNKKMIKTLKDAYDKGTSKRGAVSAEKPDGDTSSMFWGTTETMLHLKILVEKVADTDANILITGENGTGKEVLANELHRLSQRHDHKLFPVDLGAVSETLFESELFGYMKGSFTDAKVDKPGKFELAAGGTLFLDEIGNLSYALQAKLLTVLQRRCVVRVGGCHQIPVDVRIISATNRDLQQMVKDSEFREDLLYRINTIHLHLPSLRERKEDILPLAQRFLMQYSKLYDKTGLSFSEEASHKMTSLPWYGNIRELQHAVEKAVILSDSTRIGENDIEGNVSGKEEQPTETAQTLDEMEKQLIAKTIKEQNGNLSNVAALLGISRQTLYNKIKKYSL